MNLKLEFPPKKYLYNVISSTCLLPTFRVDGKEEIYLSKYNQSTSFGGDNVQFIPFFSFLFALHHIFLSFYFFLLLGFGIVPT